MTELDLEKVLFLGVKYRLKSLVMSGVQIEFGPHFEPVNPADLVPLKEKIGEEAGNPTEDQMLFWSSGGADIEAEKPA